ncbi:rhodanese-like domain containing protein [Nitzschia inconspicua]|uniref:Rhodanese-like domain containing protein n=1 Tax=Nitzschia inconspicua TaxID=303405 RepID=A0A9K3PJA9_9STRA|nr:rhodanese-like domain containing protein [Nitzschia inconspicua]
MRLLHASSNLALLHMAARRSIGAMAFTPVGIRVPSSSILKTPVEVSSSTRVHLGSLPSTTTRLFSSTGPSGEGLTIQNIGKEEMEEIVEDYEEGGREESGYVIIDVRESDEIAFTGKVSPNTLHVPLGVLAQYQIFNMDDDEFEEVCGFPKPTLDETIVFTCAAGIRSTHACNFAAQSGYSKLINYRGGANEWFS